MFNSSQANINLNFPKNWVNGTSITLQLLQCYYLIFYTNVVLVLMVETRMGVDPTKTWTPRVRPPGWLGRLTGPISPAMFRLAFRTAFLGTQVALAEWFITSGSADVILDLQALTGGVGMAAMTFFIPSVLAYGLLPRESLSDADRRFVYFCFRVGNSFDVVFFYSYRMSEEILTRQTAAAPWDASRRQRRDPMSRALDDAAALSERNARDAASVLG